MSFLLDTNILSELRKGRRCDPRVRQWAATAEPELHTSVLALGELKLGIERVRPRDARFAGELERWLTRLILVMGRRILPVDQAIALEWGRIGVARTISPIDGLLAATAVVHGLTVVTHNVKDFAGLGVSYLNPFEPLQ